MSTGSDTLASIPRPSICRQVVVSRKDGREFPLPCSNADLMLVTEMAVTVQGVVIEENLTILATIGDQWLRCPHRDLCDRYYPAETGGYPPGEMVWSWPPRS